MNSHRNSSKLTVEQIIIQTLRPSSNIIHSFPTESIVKEIEKSFGSRPSRATIIKYIHKLQDDGILIKTATSDSRVSLWKLDKNYKQSLKAKKDKLESNEFLRPTDTTIYTKTIEFTFLESYYELEVFYDLFAFINSPSYTKQMWSEKTLPDNCVQIARDDEQYHAPEFSIPNTQLFKKFIVPVIKGRHTYKIKYKYYYENENENRHETENHFPVETFIIITKFPELLKSEDLVLPSAPELLIPCDDRKKIPLEQINKTTFKLTLKNITPLVPTILLWKNPTSTPPNKMLERLRKEFPTLINSNQEPTTILEQLHQLSAT